MPTSWKGEVGSCIAACVWLMSSAHLDKHFLKASHNFLELLLCCFYMFHYSEECSPRQKCSPKDEWVWSQTYPADKTPVDITVSQIMPTVFPVKSHYNPWTQGEQSVRFPLTLWGCKRIEFCQCPISGTSWYLLYGRGTIESKINLVLQTFPVLLTSLWGAISTRCCGSHRHPGDSCTTSSVSNSCSDQHLALAQTICAGWWKWSWSHRLHVGHTHLACSKQNNFLVGPFLCKAGPCSCGSAWWIISSCTSPCVRGLVPGLCWAQLSFLVPSVETGHMREQMCQNPLLVYVKLLCPRLRDACPHDKHCTYGWVHEWCMLAALIA